ncbi:MAG TPA: ABC transporter permease subunit [Candidatus Limnocylindrales bacterium]|nr:ABC transporter permease subunit [Candidatus Limnocylindrales bacterium]
MSLMRAERRRFLKRRMIIWTLVIFVGLLATIGTIVFFTTEKVTPEVRAAAQAQADRMYNQQMQEFQRMRARCEQSPSDEICQQGRFEEPQREWFPAESFMPATFNFRNDSEDFVVTWAILLAMFAFIIGASFVGAEWRSGAMMNLLTWRPKRMQVLGTKLMALLGSLTVFSVLSFGLWTAAMVGIASTHGTMERMTNGAWQSYGLTGLRGLGMILAFAALGFGLASIGRHIGLALGMALGVIILGQFGLMAVLFMARVPYPEIYLIPSHLQAWMEKRVVIQDPFAVVSPMDEVPTRILSFGDSGSIGLGVVAVVLAVAFYTMRRRDIAN